jgi:hypothetical protein
MLKKAWQGLRLKGTRHDRPHSRRVAKRRPSVALSLELLEGRVLLAVDSWTNPLGGSWNTPGNWSSGSVPGPDDDVLINLSGNLTVHLSDGTASVHIVQVGNSLVLDGGSLTTAAGLQVSNQLTLETGTLTAGGGLTVSGGTLDFDGGSITGTATLVNAALNIGPGSTGAASFVVAGNSTLSGDIASAQTVWVQGSNANGAATLTTAGGFTNSGTLVLGSLDSWQWGVYLVVPSGTLVNAPGGSINVLQGSGAWSRIEGNFTNQGSVAVQAGIALGLTSTGGVTPTVTLAGGSVSANGTFFLMDGGLCQVTGGTVAGALLQHGGAFAFDGGSITGTATLTNAALAIGPASTGAASFVVAGNSTLSGTIAASQSVWVQGSNAYGSATLTAAGGFTNAGTLTLGSLDSWQWGVYVQVPSGTLVNAPGGTIKVLQGSGAWSRIEGNFTNDGTVAVQAGIALGLTSLGGMTPTVTLAGGSVTADGTFFLMDGGLCSVTGGTLAGTLVQNNGTFQFDGGVLSGTATLTNVALEVGPDATGGASFVIQGNSSLSGQTFPGQTLRVQGNDGVGTTTLTVVGDVSNGGTIDLESAGWAWWYGANLAITGGVLTNAATGRIDVRPGSGGSRNLTGPLINRGTIDVAAGTNLYVSGGDQTGKIGKIGENRCQFSFLSPFRGEICCQFSFLSPSRAASHPRKQVK